MGLLPELLDLVGEQVEWDVDVVLVCHEVSTIFCRGRKDTLTKMYQDHELVEYCFEFACIEESIPMLDWLHDIYFTQWRDIGYLYSILLQSGKEKTVRWLYENNSKWIDNSNGHKYGYFEEEYFRCAVRSRNPYLVLLHYRDDYCEYIAQVLETNDVELAKCVIAKYPNWNINFIVETRPWLVSDEMYKYLTTELNVPPKGLFYHRLQLANLALLGNK